MRITTIQDWGGNMSIEQVEDSDKKLYGFYSFGKGNRRDKGQCLHYSIKVEEDGQYEMALRTIEPKYQNVGERVNQLIYNSSLTI